jgi:hypothetical protein
MNLIQFKQGSTAFVLQGTGMAGPVKGAVLWKDRPSSLVREAYVPLPPSGEGGTGSSASQTVEDIRISLAGTPAEIEGGLQACARWLAEAARVSGIPGEDKVFLEAQVYPGGVTWRSLVEGGTYETLGAGPDQRNNQSQGLRLLVERLNYWEDATERELYLSSAATARATGGVTLTNHWDAGHANYAHLAAADAGGDLPAPARLSLVGAATGQGSVFAGENISADPGNAGLLLEGEDGTAGQFVTKSGPAGAGYSSNVCARLSWNGTNTMLLLRLALPTALLQQLGGMPFLLLVKLGAMPAGAEEFWASWRLVYNSGANRDILATTRAAYLDVNREYQEGGVLFLPPWRVESGESPAGLDLELMVQADDAGDHTLDVDFLFLLPLEHWRIYRQKALLLAQLAVYDNPYAGTVKSYGALQGHQVEGPGLWVWPNRLQRFYFLYEPFLYAGTTIAQEMTVRMWYRPRKRTL